VSWVDEDHDDRLPSEEENQRKCLRALSSAIRRFSPVFRGTRVPFKSLTDYLEHERSLSEFLEDFPSVSRADAIAALEEARNSLVATLK